MRRKRKQATSVIVAGVVHAIGDTAQSESPIDWAGVIGGSSALSEFPLRRKTRASRKVDKARRLRESRNLRVRLACEISRFWKWHNVPRTHAAITCMTCLVVMARRYRW